MVGINALFSTLRAQSAIPQRAAALVAQSERVGSGSRLNRASDDPGSLAVSVILSGRIKSSSGALRGLSDKISLASLASGVLSIGSDITDRLAELATQSANGTLSDSQRESLNKEYQSLSSELRRIGESTKFNGEKIFGVGGGSDGLSLSALDPESLGLEADLSSQDGARRAIDQVKVASEVIAQSQGNVAQFSAGIEQSLQALKTEKLASSEALSRITDSDVAAESAALVASRIGLQSATAISAQANVQSQNAAFLII